MRGGFFQITFKTLILDLLAKKISPSIISGFLINKAHKIETKCPESFLTQILKKDNQVRIPALHL